MLDTQWTLGDIFQQAGYTTGIIGKYHLGGDVYSAVDWDLAFGKDEESSLDFSRPLVNSATKLGFDFSFLNLNGIQLPPYAFFRNGLLYGDPSNMVFWESGQYGYSNIENAGYGLSSWDTSEIQSNVLNQAQMFVSDSVASQPSSPFFLYLPLAAIHSPYTPPSSLSNSPVDGVSGIGNKGDMVHAVDIIVGELVQKLEEEGVLDSTLIIFTSDNGALSPVYEANLGHDTAGGLRGLKTSIFEGGHRVPLIVRWGDGTSPGSYIEPGSKSDELISLQDFVPTLAQIIGINLPPNQGQDSFNMIPALFPSGNSFPAIQINRAGAEFFWVLMLLWPI